MNPPRGQTPRPGQDVQPVQADHQLDNVRSLSSVSTPVITFTVAEAARECGVAEKTIRRKLDQLEQHGATRSPDGQWVIPWAALHAIGLHAGTPAGPDMSIGHPAMSSGLDQDTTGLRHRLALVEKERDGLLALVESERRAAESERKRADALEYVIRHQLTAGERPPEIPSDAGGDLPAREQREQPAGRHSADAGIEPVTAPAGPPPDDAQVLEQQAPAKPPGRFRALFQRRK